jgi:hypothetical protein
MLIRPKVIIVSQTVAAQVSKVYAIFVANRVFSDQIDMSGLNTTAKRINKKINVILIMVCSNKKENLL